MYGDYLQKYRRAKQYGILKKLHDGVYKNISDKRRIKSITKITDEEQLTKIALTENKNVQAAFQAVSRIKSQENLDLIALTVYVDGV